MNDQATFSHSSCATGLPPAAGSYEDVDGSVSDDSKIVGGAVPTNANPTMSKNARKRLLRMEKMKAIKVEQKQAKKDAKKKRRLESHSAAQSSASSSSITLSDTSLSSSSSSSSSSHQAFRGRRRVRARDFQSSRLNSAPVIVFDLSFEELMSGKEVISLVKQIRYCYGVNVRNPHPLRLLCSSFKNVQDESHTPLWKADTYETAQRSSNETIDNDSKTATISAVDDQKVIERQFSSLRELPAYPNANTSIFPRVAQCSLFYLQSGFAHWQSRGFSVSPLHFTHLFPASRVIYLTAESSNVVSSLSADCVYVIGALVDHNRYPGLCERLAKEMGINTARLPLKEQLNVAGKRTVIAINHVFDVMSESWKQLQHKQESADADTSSGIDWKTACRALPARFGWSDKQDTANDTDELHSGVDSPSGKVKSMVAAQFSAEDKDASVAHEAEDDDTSRTSEHSNCMTTELHAGAPCEAGGV